MKLFLILCILTLCSCNSAFVVKTKGGTEMGYVGSLASKSDYDKAEIQLANGAVIKREIVKNDEVEAVRILGRLQLGKTALDTAAATANKTVTTLAQ